MPTKRNPKKRPLTAREREEERDYQVLKRAKGRLYDFRQFAKELGYEIKDRKRR